MSGHSKWATIHRQKEAKDAKRGAIFTKLAANIVVAVRQGGGIGDPDKNFRLRLAIEKARQFNMPKDNVSRAVEKGMGGSGGGQLMEAMYEGFLPGGCVVIAEVVTDNTTRTAQSVRGALEKHGGSMGGSGAVAYLFKPAGEVRVKFQPGKSVQDQELMVMDIAGIEDIENDESGIVAYCDREQAFRVKEDLEKLGFEVESADVVMRPMVPIKVEDVDMQEKIEATLTAVDELDDVVKVFTNYRGGEIKVV